MIQSCQGKYDKYRFMVRFVDNKLSSHLLTREAGGLPDYVPTLRTCLLTYLLIPATRA